MPSTISRDLFDPYVPEFLNHLRTAGCSDSHIPNFPGSVKHFLVWLQLGRIGIGKIDNAVLRRFRNHHCRCPRPKGERYLNSTKRERGSCPGCCDSSDSLKSRDALKRRAS